MVDGHSVIPGDFRDREPYSLKRHSITLGDCDREPVQTPGCVQAHGALLVLRPGDLAILQASESTLELLGAAPGELLGTPVAAALGADAAARLEQALELKDLERNPLYVLTLQLDSQRPPLVVTMHTLAGSVIVELEPELKPSSTSRDYYRLLRETLDRIHATDSLLDLSTLAAQEIRAITGFDRVMIYRFHPDGSGEVIAESCPDTLPSWLGLRYPAADIPAPARDIYRRSWVRCVADVAGGLAELVPLVNPETGRPLEMIHCALRGPSVMYTEYLANIDVHASVTMSIRRDEHLWGMIACHHHAGPKPVSFAMRAACEVLAKVFSLLHHAAEQREELDHRLCLDGLHERLVERARAPDGGALALSSLLEGEPSLLDGIPAEGVALFHEGTWFRSGTTPDTNELDVLAQWLEERQRSRSEDRVYATDSLAREHVPAAAYEDRAAGVLAFAIEQPQRIVVAWFRPETVRTVRWRGNPYEKPKVTGPHGDRLTPRRSFALWLESVRGRSIPWTEVEIEAASRFCAMLERRAFEHALRAADQQKDVFIATLAHELRNPLAPISTSLRVLESAPADSAASDQARSVMDRQVRHMVRLIDDLLDISRISRGRIELRREPVDMQATVERAIEVARPAIDAARQVLVVSTAGEPLPVNGDPFRLTQVIGNLLNNAAKYTAAGGRIEVESRRQGSHAVVRVRDTGIGIAPEMLPKVFDLFAQDARALDKAQGGLGIGLSLAHELVRLHGGTLIAESPGAGQGSTFTVRVPLSEPAPAERVAPAAQSEPPALGAVRRRVLVVDDNVDAAQSLAMFLEILGHEVRVAHDGPSALALASGFTPELALLDIGLPGMDGHELARRMHADPALRNTMLVALTGWGTEEDKQRSREAGFDEHLIKPVDAGRLRGLLASLVTPRPN
jgi:two-component system, chemotaxis family, sensor kinase Cph1